MKTLQQLLRAGASTVWNLLLWTAWLGLALLLVVQVYIASSNELTLPDFVLRRLEDRLAESGVKIEFKRTAFDPTGRILLQDVRVTLPPFAEPVLTAHALYAHLNPGILFGGRLEPREFRVMGASIFIPAMLSRTGQTEEIISNLEATVTPESRSYVVHQLNGRAAGVDVSAHGMVPIPKSPGGTPDLTALLAKQFPAICRQATTWASRLSAFDQPSVDLELTTSDAGTMVVNATLLARSARIEAPVAVEARSVRVATRALLLADASTSQIEVTADEIKLPFDTTARRLRGQVLGGLESGPNFKFDPREAELSLDAVSSHGFAAEALSAQLLPRSWPQLEANIVAALAGAPLGVHSRVDLKTGTGRIDFRGEISPLLLVPLSELLGVDVRRFYDWEEMFCHAGAVQLGPNWKFNHLSANVDIPRSLAYGIRMEDGHAQVEFDGKRFYSPGAFARIGENFASATYDHDLATQRYRFLLDGQLRPLDISAWFRPWWSNFFDQLDFTAAPPVASVDVQGVWREGRDSAVFVRAEVKNPVVRGTRFDDLSTRLFIRPGFFDGLMVHTTAGPARADGKFTLELDPDSHDLQQFDLALDSTLPLATVAQVIGRDNAQFLDPFQVESPPTVNLRGRFEGAAGPKGAHQTVDATIRTTGTFHYLDFPVHDASFGLKIRDQTVDVDNIAARFASGAVTGKARVWDENKKRRVGFDFAIHDASLGDGVSALQAFFARRRGEPPPPPGKFVQEKANVRVELDASAEGEYGEPFTYHGAGNVVLRGAEIGAVPLFGSLSELLKFTNLRFTEARGTFKIDGPKLNFSDVTLRGANSAIDGHGIYALDAQVLDFNAKVFPFQESNNVVKSVVGAVLAPLSNALEVKLTGSLEKPEWRFALLSGLSEPAAGTEKAEQAPAQPGPNPLNATEDKSLGPPK